MTKGYKTRVLEMEGISWRDKVWVKFTSLKGRNFTIYMNKFMRWIVTMFI